MHREDTGDFEDRIINLEIIARAIVNYIKTPRQPYQPKPISLIIDILQAEYDRYNSYSYLTAPYHYLAGNKEIAQHTLRCIEDLKQISARTQTTDKDKHSFACLERLRVFFAKGVWAADSVNTKLICALIKNCRLQITDAALSKMLLQNSGKDFVTEFDVIISAARAEHTRSLSATRALTGSEEEVLDHFALVLAEQNAGLRSRAFFQRLSPIQRTLRAVADSVVEVFDESSDAGSEASEEGLSSFHRHGP